MSKAKMRLYLEMAFDLLQRVHTSICHSGVNREKKLEISEDIQKIESQIFLLDKKLREVKINDR